MYIINTSDQLADNDNKYTSGLALQHAENISDVLKWLLIQKDISFNEDDVQRKIASFEKWIEAYRACLVAASKIKSSDIQWLSEVCKQLKLLANERSCSAQGNKLCVDESHQTSQELIKASQLIEKGIPELEQMFISKKDKNLYQ